MRIRKNVLWYLALLPLVVIALTCRHVLSGYEKPTKQIDCPIAINLLNDTIPAYERVGRKGLWIVVHCDGTKIKDTVK